MLTLLIGNVKRSHRFGSMPPGSRAWPGGIFGKGSLPYGMLALGVALIVADARLEGRRALG